MELHLFLPLLTPLLGVILASLLQRWTFWTRPIVGLAALINFGYGLWLVREVPLDGWKVTRVGALPAPYGIVLVADRLSALFIMLAALVTFHAIFFSYATLDRQREQFFFYPLMLLVLLSVNSIVLTGDIFNLYIWLVVLLVATLSLIVLGGRRSQLQSGLKYALLLLLGSTNFLVGCGLLYGLTGSLNMAQVSMHLAALDNPGVRTVVAGLFLVACGAQAAIFPWCFWIPGSQDAPPVAVAMLSGGLLTKVGMYTLYRCFSLLYPADLGTFAPWLLLLATVTILVGVVGAGARTTMRRMLSFLLISQSGYMLMGLGLGTEKGLSAGLLVMVHDMLVQPALFCLGGIVEYNSRTGNIQQLGGLARREPVLAMMWLLAFLSLVGVPPLGGFFVKLALLEAAVEQQAYASVAVVILATLLSLLPFLTIWNEVFWKRPPDDAPFPLRATIHQLVPALVLVGLLLLFTLGIEMVIDYSFIAAHDLRAVGMYQSHVLGSPLPAVPEQ